jgi:D-serine deaminase-like pyridoxal phosphate-dependent protein
MTEVGERTSNQPGNSRVEESLGKPVDNLLTPALLLRRDALERNLERMKSLVTGPTRLRPHAKTHKSAQIASLQVQSGAIGITTATVWEALSLASAGIGDILIANEVVGAEKIRCLSEAARNARITVAVDNPANARDLSDSARCADVELGVVVDVDVGLGRCGVRSLHEGVALAKQIAELPGLLLRGVMGFEGHCTFEPDPKRRSRFAREAMSRLLQVADALEAHGQTVDVVSAGGTGTYDSTGSNPRVTEIQVGSYAFMDTSHAAIVPGFDYALTVLSTVVSRHGNTVVLDAGKKSLGLDDPPPSVVGHAAAVRYVAEEHTVLDFDSEVPALGASLELVPGYCPVTVNLHDLYLVVDDGVVVDAWPILARGAGWSSMR